jgi:hypothetical protein
MTASPTFDQRVRDARTILEARWPPGRLPLSDELQNIVAFIMIDYAIQCELEILRRQDEERTE